MTFNLNPSELQSLLKPLVDALLPAMEKRAAEQAKAMRRELRCLTVEQVAKRLQWSEKTVLDRIKRGLLNAANVGTWENPSWRVSEADLDAFYQQHRAGK